MSSGGVVGVPIPSGIITALKETTVTVSPAQMLNFDNTSAGFLELVAAQPGEIILVERFDFNMQYGGVAYATGTSDCILSWETALNTFTSMQSGVIVSTGNLKTADSVFVSTVPTIGAILTAAGLAAIVGKRVGIKGTTAVKYTAGNSFIFMKARWRTIRLS